MFFLQLIVRDLISWLLNSFVLCILWKWFIVSHFGLAPLTLPIALGIIVIYGLFKNNAYAASASLEDLEDRQLYIWLNTFVYPGLTLLSGWIAHLL